MNGKQFGEFLGLSDVGLPDGNEVRISLFQTDHPGPRADISRDDVEGVHAWLTQWLKENPVKVEGWVNVYSSGDAWMYETREKADSTKGHSKTRIACIPISYHIGQGLEREAEE